MGKPFGKELEVINETLGWAAELDTTAITEHIASHRDQPYLVVGSGGSLSACHYAVGLLQQKGIVAKALTPLDVFYSRDIINICNVLFISASGGNTDIQLAFKTAVQHDPASIAILCMKQSSPLAKLAQGYSKCRVFEFNQPAGKDGFLATNSLAAFFTILSKCLDEKFTPLMQKTVDESHDFIKEIDKDFTYTVLFGGWGESVAVDIESKLTEAALGAALLSNYRNFGHGRHHWFAKRGYNSAIIALITPAEEELARKTLSIVPSEIPRLILSSSYTTSVASIDLLIKSFHFVKQLGIIQNIDPGRPGVPSYGRKLYNLNYGTLLSNRRITAADAAIRKKRKASNCSVSTEQVIKSWRSSYDAFVQLLAKAKFGSIVFDYDGTLCPVNNKLLGVPETIGDKLIEILSAGFIVAIATGRGQSVRKEIQRAIPQHLWDNVIVGYYNGSEVSSLGDENAPDRSGTKDPVIKKAYDLLMGRPELRDVKLELRPHQITVEIKDKIDWHCIKDAIRQTIATSGIPDIQVVESSHSLDIISSKFASKRNVIAHCEEKARALGIPPLCLCIGDKGQWPGNDYELLNTPFSLSVDEVSSSHTTCWNIAGIGLYNEGATLHYLNQLKLGKAFFQYKTA
jgi:hydroxymethylpyrimidine pyrophosphatase-like HAD family hydrolase